MSSLRDLQRRFVGALFNELPVPGETQTAAGFEIYVNNLNEGFLKALALEFPVIQRLVGEDYFRQLARNFLRAHPSQAGDLHAIGAPFPNYLRRCFAGTEYAYLPDVAALEWAYEQASIAADAPVFDVRSLARVRPDEYGELRFNLHPACHLASSSYPILRIWQVNQVDADPDLTVDLATGPDYLVTRRTARGVELIRVPYGDYRLLECFAHNETLGEALSTLQRVEPAFDLGNALRRLIASGMISELQTAPPFANKGILP
ncbi:MAG: putative DNA-binding domain-containing protein [Proteobacteria bacterium]|nr:putative DNA-binding domain-containing protein [Pseudomonadota bacterium]